MILESAQGPNSSIFFFWGIWFIWFNLDLGFDLDLDLDQGLTIWNDEYKPLFQEISVTWAGVFSVIITGSD